MYNPQPYCAPGYTWQQAYETLLSSHWVQNVVWLIDQNHNFVMNLSDRLIDGSLDVDADADVTRSLDLTLANVDGLFHPDQLVGGVYPNRFIQVWHMFGKFPLYSSPVAAFPMFTGPITSVDPNGPLVDLECQGKEYLLQEGLWQARQYGAGFLRASAIFDMAVLYGGEFFLDFDYSTSTFTKNFTVPTETDVWDQMKEWADSMGYQLFYNGLGRLRLRPKQTQPCMDFNPTNMTSPPDPGFDISNLINVARVVGGAPKNEVGSWVWDVYPPANHPYSPQSLARNGHPRFIPSITEDDSLGTYDEANVAAWTSLSQGLVAGYTCEFTAAIMPWLEEGDMISITTPSYANQLLLSKFTIPLVGDAEMSVGFLSNKSLGYSRGHGQLVGKPHKPKKKNGKGKKTKTQTKKKTKKKKKG